MPALLVNRVWLYIRLSNMGKENPLKTPYSSPIWHRLVVARIPATPNRRANRHFPLHIGGEKSANVSLSVGASMLICPCTNKPMALDWAVCLGRMQSL